MNCEKNQLKLWQNSKTQIVTKLRNSNFNQSFLVVTTWHLDYQWDVFEAAFCDLAMFSFKKGQSYLPPGEPVTAGVHSEGGGDQAQGSGISLYSTNTGRL